VDGGEAMKPGRFSSLQGFKVKTPRTRDNDKSGMGLQYLMADGSHIRTRTGMHVALL